MSELLSWIWEMPGEDLLAFVAIIVVGGALLGGMIVMLSDY